MSTVECLCGNCRALVWILQNVCMNIAECLYRYCRSLYRKSRTFKWILQQVCVLQNLYMNTAERLYQYCIKFISVLQKVHMYTAESLHITENLYEYCKSFMWKLQNICVNTTERLYENYRTLDVDTVERLCGYCRRFM